MVSCCSVIVEIRLKGSCESCAASRADCLLASPFAGVLTPISAVVQHAYRLARWCRLIWSGHQCTWQGPQASGLDTTQGINR